MIKNLEHIGIAVKSIKEGKEKYEILFGPAYKEEVVESEGVKTVFFNAGNVKVELLESLMEDGLISRFIEKRGEGIHHLAFEVEDIEIAMKSMEEKGFELINKEPKKGADNKLVCFIHPKSANGVLIEICQEIL